MKGSPLRPLCVKHDYEHEEYWGLKMRYVLTLAVLAAVGLSAAAQAATVDNVSGAVSINKGSGYKRVGSGAAAAPGDIIMTSAEGSAQIVYPNGCVENVGPSSVVTVSEAPVCTPGAAFGGSQIVGALATVAIFAGVIAGAESGGDGAGAGGNPPQAPNRAHDCGKILPQLIG